MSKHKIRYVFTVSHAMQYMNALEARDSRGLPKHLCAILLFNKPYDRQIKQLQSVVDGNDWGYVEFITYPNYWAPRGERRILSKKIAVYLSKILSAKLFDRKIRRFFEQYCEPPLLLCATGNYISRPHRHALALAERKYSAKELMVLDEGTSIPNLIVPIRHNIKTEKMKRFKYRYSRKDVGGLILNHLTPMTYHHPKSITFFTLYDDISVPRPDKVEVNHFAHARKIIAQANETQEVWFLGNCYVEYGYAHEEKYLYILKQFQNFFPDKAVYYFPHRYEQPDKLEKIDKMDLPVISPDLNIEARMITKQIRPSAVAAIATSAIDNITTMFDGAIPIHLYKPAPQFFARPGIIPAIYEIIDGHQKNGRGMVTVHQVDFT